MSRKTVSRTALALLIGATLAMGSASRAEDLIDLPFDIPEASFTGTPIDYWSPSLEPETFKARAPFKAPAGTALISKGKPVSASATPTLGKLEQLTDGDKEFGKKSVIELPTGIQWVQVDLESEKAIYAVLLWHWYEGKRVYFDVVVQASNDVNFKDSVSLIYNNDYDNSAGLGVGSDKEYHEKNEGRLMDAKGVKARYVRFYSKGNHANENNHYIEAEIWGK